MLIYLLRSCLAVESSGGAQVEGHNLEG
jgi:hypothetical protein